jgi:hypothetical protein
MPSLSDELEPSVFTSTSRSAQCARMLLATTLCASALSPPTARGAPPLKEVPGNSFSRSPRSTESRWTPAWALRQSPFAEVKEAAATRSLDGARSASIPGAAVAGPHALSNANEIGSLAPLGSLAERWATTPGWMATARNLRRDGLPLFRLGHNSPMLLSVGVNRRGMPSIFFVRKFAH